MQAADTLNHFYPIVKWTQKFNAFLLRTTEQFCGGELDVRFRLTTYAWIVDCVTSAMNIRSGACGGGGADGTTGIQGRGASKERNYKNYILLKCCNYMLLRIVRLLVRVALILWELA